MNKTNKFRKNLIYKRKSIRRKNRRKSITSKKSKKNIKKKASAKKRRVRKNKKTKRKKATSKGVNHKRKRSKEAENMDSVKLPSLEILRGIKDDEIYITKKQKVLEEVEKQKDLEEIEKETLDKFETEKDLLETQKPGEITGTFTQQRLPDGALKASIEELSRRDMEPYRVDSLLQPGDLEWEKDPDFTRRITANEAAKRRNTKQAKKQALKKREG